MTIDTIIIVLLLLAVIALIAVMLIKNGNGKASAEAVREEYERRMTEMERRFTERDRQNAEASEARFKALAEESLRIQSNQIRRTNSEQMEALLSPMRQRLEEFNRACTDSYVAENAARKSLADQIERLMELNRTIGDEARNLTSALKNNSRQQGRWGEIILETMLEKAGLKRDINFSSQLTRDSSGNTLRDDDSGRGLRPDVVVFLPDDHCLIIDSKVSLNAYTDFCGTDDETNRQMAGKRHLESVRRHIKELADKQYQRMVKNSAEHVLMFIPNEGAYITAVGLDPDLWDYAYQRKVCIVAPAHLFSVMQLINQMWNSEQRNNNADNIAKLGGLLYDKFVGFANELQRIEKSLDDARNAYDACYRSLTRGGTSLVSRAERLRALGVKNAKILGEKIREESECSTQES